MISLETYSREVVAITKLPFSSHAKKTTQQEVKNVDKDWCNISCNFINFPLRSWLINGTDLSLWFINNVTSSWKSSPEEPQPCIVIAFIKHG